MYSIVSHTSPPSIFFTPSLPGVGSQGDGTVQVLCRSPEDQRLALSILHTDLHCEAFLLTVPVALPSIERPIVHPYRVRCALVVSDPKASQRYVGCCYCTVGIVGCDGLSDCVDAYVVVVMRAGGGRSEGVSEVRENALWLG